MIKIYCGVHLIGLSSTCTNPVLYAFFNENLRKEFEFMAECIFPRVFFRATSVNRQSQRNSPNAPNNQRSMLQKLRPRRDDNNMVITQLVPIDDDDIELDPTFHRETGDDINENEGVCDCFKEENSNGNGKKDMEMVAIKSVA